MSTQHETRDADARAIDALRKELGDEVVLLGHHYQHQDIVDHCDFLVAQGRKCGGAAYRVLRRLFHG